jgi:hypothetical protein
VFLRNVVASPCCDTPLKQLWMGVASKHSLFAFSSLRRGGVDKSSIGGQVWRGKTSAYAYSSTPERLSTAVSVAGM